MKYYILYPDQQKDNIDYRKQLAADSGMKTIYLQPAFHKIITSLSLIGKEQFEKEICNPDDIIIFSEQGDEWSIDGFVDYVHTEYDNLRHNF